MPRHHVDSRSVLAGNNAPSWHRGATVVRVPSAPSSGGAALIVPPVRLAGAVVLSVVLGQRPSTRALGLGHRASRASSVRWPCARHSDPAPVLVTTRFNFGLKTHSGDAVKSGVARDTRERAAGECGDCPDFCGRMRAQRRAQLYLVALRRCERPFAVRCALAALRLRRRLVEPIGRWRDEHGCQYDHA